MTSTAADGDNTLIESSPIVEWLDWKFPNSGTRILPEDLMDRYKVRRWPGEPGQRPW